MKITFLVNWDSASAHALSLLAPSLIFFDVSVFYTRKSSGKTRMPEALKALAEFETQQLKQKQAIFEKFDAQCLNDINGADYLKFANSKPDLVISIRHMSILKDKVINTPAHGVINLHSGLLPNYQGVMATFWAMKNQENNIGTTLHFIEDATIDTGAIISQSSTTTRFDKSYYWNMLNIYQDGCQNIIRAIQTTNIGEPLQTRAQSGQAHYFSFPADKDLDEFKYSIV